MTSTYQRAFGLAVGLVVASACGGDSEPGGVGGSSSLGGESSGGVAGAGGAAGAAGVGGSSGGSSGVGGAAAGGTGGSSGAAGAAAAGGAAGEAGAGSGGAAGTAGTAGSNAGGTGGAAAGSGGSDDGEGGSESAGAGGDEGEGGSDNAGAGGEPGTILTDGGVCESDAFSGEPAAAPTGGLAATVASVGDCPAIAPQPLGNQQWVIAAVHFLSDDSADVLIQNVRVDTGGFGDLFSVCNEQPNCVFVHDNTAGLQIPAGGLVQVNVPNTTQEGGELAIYTNNLSIPHPIFCDLLGRAFAFHIVQWGTGPGGDHSLLSDAIRDFDWWTPGDLITIDDGDTGFSVTGDSATEQGYTSCNPDF